MSARDQDLLRVASMAGRLVKDEVARPVVSLTLVRELRAMRINLRRSAGIFETSLR